MNIAVATGRRTLAEELRLQLADEIVRGGPASMIAHIEYALLNASFAARCNHGL